MPDEPAEFDPTAILRVLVAYEVKFVVVGGVSGNLHGSTTLTEDIDIAYARDRENLERLASALRELRAIDSAARDVDYVDFEIASAKDPMQRAVARILNTALDGRDHRLRNPRFRSELTLSQPLALSCRSYKPARLHIWKSISSG